MGFNSGFKGLIFTALCIVIYSYSTTNQIHLLSQIIYSCKTRYMFRTVFLSIIKKVPSHPWEQQLFDIYLCCIHSFELLMMDRKTVRNMQSVLQE